MARVVHVGVEPLAIAVKLAGAPRRAVGERVLEHHPRRVRDDELLVVAGVDPERLVRLPAVGVIGLRVADVGVGPDPLAAVLVEAAGAAAVQVQLHDIDDGHRPAPLAGRGVAPAPGLFDAGRVEVYVPVAVEPHRGVRPVVALRVREQVSPVAVHRVRPVAHAKGFRRVVAVADRDNAPGPLDAASRARGVAASAGLYPRHLLAEPVFLVLVDPDAVAVVESAFVDVAPEVVVVAAGAEVARADVVGVLPQVPRVSVDGVRINHLVPFDVVVRVALLQVVAVLGDGLRVIGDPGRGVLEV